MRRFKTFKPFNRCAQFNPPPLVLPRGAGEDEGGGLIVLNGLNDLNLMFDDKRFSKNSIMRFV